MELDYGLRRGMIEEECKLSLKIQCEILGISRSSIYYELKPKFSSQDIQIMNKIDEIYTRYPFYGYRRQYLEIIENGFSIGEDRVRQLMRTMDLKVFYPKKTSIADKEHQIYPYLLRGLTISKPGQVWACDITYIKMLEGFCYLVAVIDWYSRYVLSWRLSNSLDVHFCLDALEEALQYYPRPEIFNTDQGSQFTSNDFTKILLKNEIKISMDSVGRWADNVIIERFFRSLKWEDIYLKNYGSVKDTRLGSSAYIRFYNLERKHSALNHCTPYTVFMNLN